MGGFRLGMAKGGEREGFRRGGILGCVDGGEGSPSLASSAVLASLPKRLPPPPPTTANTTVRHGSSNWWHCICLLVFGGGCDVEKKIWQATFKKVVGGGEERLEVG